MQDPGYSSFVDDGHFNGEQNRAGDGGAAAVPAYTSGGGDGKRGNDIETYESTMAAVDAVIRNAQEYNPGNLVPPPSPLKYKPGPASDNESEIPHTPTPPPGLMYRDNTHQRTSNDRETKGAASGLSFVNDSIVEHMLESTPPRPKGADAPRTPEAQKGKQPGWNLIPEDWTPLRFKRSADDSFDDDDMPAAKRWARNCSILLAVTVVLVGLFFAAKEYMGPLLKWVTEENPVIGGVTYFLIVVLTCFPGMMGFVIVNVGAGYIYGCWYGIMFMVPASLLGCVVAFMMLKKMCSSCTRYSKRKYTNYKQLVKLLEGDQGLKYICMIRCCPLPVGIENSLLAMSDVKIMRFVLGTLFGMFPNTVLYCYLGSELQDLDGVTEGKSPVGVIVAEVILIIAISTYIGYRVNKELKKSQESLPYSPTGSNPPSSLSLAAFKEMQHNTSEGEKVPLLCGIVTSPSSSQTASYGGGSGGGGGGGNSHNRAASGNDASITSTTTLGLELAKDAANEKGAAVRTKSGRIVSLYQSQAW